VVEVLPCVVTEGLHFVIEGPLLLCRVYAAATVLPSASLSGSSQVGKQLAVLLWMQLAALSSSADVLPLT